MYVGSWHGKRAKKGTSMHAQHSLVQRRGACSGEFVFACLYNFGKAAENEFHSSHIRLRRLPLPSASL